MRKLDLEGKDFNNLHVIRYSHNIKDKRAWECKCKCGKLVYVVTSKLVSGDTKSCGCISAEMTQKSKRKMPSGDRVGVTYEESTNKFRVRIARYKKTYHIGRYDSEQEAMIMRAIANTFSEMNQFLEWYTYRQDCLEVLTEVCLQQDISREKIVESIYDNLLGELYLDHSELRNFIIDFTASYKEAV